MNNHSKPEQHPDTETGAAKTSWKLKLVRILIWTIALVGLAETLSILQTPRYEVFVEGQLSCFLVILGLSVSIGTLIYFLIQSVLAFLYREAPILSDAELPRCTVIIPAFNEGEYVATTLDSVLAGDYPPEKLEVIAINDGSTDDTWAWMLRAAERHPGRIRTVNLARNGGKRHALYEGFMLASGEVVVTVDSDSILAPDALRRIVSPFRNPQVGAVAGNIRVTNLEEGIIPRMLDTAFAFGFEFMRTAQSVVHSVLCTPGALSAYRTGAIRPLAREWLEQRFLGKPSGIGEDRAITSLLIRSGWSVTYQGSAMAFTKMPTSYPTLCKMLIRWCRSDVRENLLMLSYCLRGRMPLTWWLPPLLLNLVFQSITILLPMFVLPMLLYGLVVRPLVSLGYLVAFSTLWSALPALVYALRYGKAEAVWAFVYGLYCLPLLSWISVYSFFTMRNSKWLTRPAADPAEHDPEAEQEQLNSSCSALPLSGK